MQTVTVQGFRGAVRAELSVSPIALLAGRNGAGKSSICQAVAAALTGHPVPFLRPGEERPAVAKKDANLLVTAGTKNGRVTIMAEGGEASVSWPACEVTTSGQEPPRASSVAAGLLDPMEMTPVAFSAWLGGIIKAAPDQADLMAALRDGPGAGMAEEVWGAIEEHGWDGANGQYRTAGTKARGAWEEATGERYGSQKGEGWLPAGWYPYFVGRTAAQLQQEAEAASARYEEALKQQGVDAAELKQLAAAAGAPKIDLGSLESDLAAAMSAHAQAKADRESLPPATDGAGMPCPHCGGSVVVEKLPGDVLRVVAVEPLDAGELKRRRVDIAGAEGRIKLAKDEVTKVEQAVSRAREGNRLIDDAKRRLENARARTGYSERTETAKMEADTAACRVEMARKVARANELHRQIQSLAMVVKALSPDGVRGARLARSLAGFNDTLRALSSHAGWGDVLITDDLTMIYSGRPVQLLSASERFRVRVTIQVAAAVADGSSMVVIDGADILDPPGRGGLIQMLAARANLNALVAMTAGSPGKVPDLAAAGMGATCWIEGGIVDRAA